MHDQTFTVSQLATMIRAALDTCFGEGVWVQGEIRSISRSRNGHVYFDLVETAGSAGRHNGDRPGSANPSARVSIVLFDDRRREVNEVIKDHGGSVRMDDGVRIRIHGYLDYYAPMGKLSLQMVTIDPAFTLGAMAGEREALLADLQRSGKLRANADRPLPTVPQRIGIVTSLGSAAHADIVKVFRRSGLAFTLVEVDTPVQGLRAERRIAAAVGTAADSGAELVILARGGGAKTDLAVFDHALVAEAIAAAPVAVICGIGHETDRSVADEVAHTTAATPTAAAAAIVAITKAFLARLNDHEQRLAHLGRRAAAAADQRLSHLRRRVATSAMTPLHLGNRSLDDSSRRLVQVSGRKTDKATALLHEASRRLVRASDRITDRAAARLGQAASQAAAAPLQVLRIASNRVDSAEARARALDPQRALARGWSITRGPGGHVVRSLAEAAPGTELSTLIADGTLTSTVTAARTATETSTAAAATTVTEAKTRDA